MKAVDPNGSGPKWERDTVDYAYARGFRNWDRAPRRGNRDLLDVTGCQSDGWLIGCKAMSRATLSDRLSDAMNQCRAALANFERMYPGHKDVIPVQILKRRNHRTGRAYVVMEFDDFLRLAEMRRDWEVERAALSDPVVREAVAMAKAGDRSLVVRRDWDTREDK